ncbi:MAG: hypothetical protein ACREGD_04995 [Candidatus Saccharimonadales bacterium]
MAFDQLPEPVAIKKRRIVIGYRGRPLPYWYGTLGQEKVWIGQKMKAICEARRIPVDIAWEEHQRIYGRKWYEFLGSCRATLGTESGSNVFDDDGSIRESILTEIKNDPGFSYEQVNEKYLREYERPGLMNQISPKVFEAIAMRTALVLFEGKYSEVLEPERHFIPLRKDFSNIDSVLNTLADLPYLEELTQRAYREVVESGRYTYKRFAEMVDNVLQQHAVHIAPNRLRQNNDVLDSALSRVLDQGAITMSPVRCYIESAAAKPRSLPEAITHRIQSIIGIRREPRGDNVPLKISRRMLETQLNFYREHGIECAFDHRPDTYVAANKGQAMPQSFSVNLRRRRSIDRVVVQWVSPGNLAEAYCLRLRVGDRVTWQKSADGNELQLNAFEMCGAEADCIELSVNRFRGQQRLLLRNVQIFPKQS